MSDTVLRFIPSDPAYVPPEHIHQKAVALLEELMPEGEMCEAEVYHHITFIEQAENLESVICPNCKKIIKVFGLQQNEEIVEWMYNLLDQSNDMPADEMKAKMPCCGQVVPFMSLTFDWPAGFARFELSIWNPEIERPVEKKVIIQLEELLGCSLIEIWAHY